MLELLYTSTKTVELGASIPKGVYIASWDAALYHSLATAGDFRKFFKDGTSFEMGQVDFNGAYLSAEGGRGAARVYQYINEGEGYHDVNDLALLDEISGLPLLGQNINKVDLTGKVGSGSFVDHTNGLVYTPGSMIISGGIYYQEVKVYALATGALVKTLNIPFSMSYSWSPMWAHIHYVNSASLLLCAYESADGKIVIFDRQTGAVSFAGTVNPDNKAIVYDSCHNVVIVLLDTGQVAVYALNNVGYALSAPSFSPSAALYTLSKVTTRLSSEEGLGIAGKAVLWWLTGDKGYLETPYSLTDEGGYAENWYYGPAGDYGLGSETINVEVVF